MKFSPHVELILSQVRGEYIAGQHRVAGEPEAKHADGTGPEHMLAANAAYKTLLLEEAARGSCSWRAGLAVATAVAATCTDPVELRATLLKCAAVIVAWINDIDTRKV